MKTDSEKLDELLYYARLQEWRNTEPRMTPMYLPFDSDMVLLENKQYKTWIEMKPKLGED
jgi:hypothetical protein